MRSDTKSQIQSSLHDIHIYIGAQIKRWAPTFQGYVTGQCSILPGCQWTCNLHSGIVPHLSTCPTKKCGGGGGGREIALGLDTQEGIAFESTWDMLLDCDTSRRHLTPTI